MPTSQDMPLAQKPVDRAAHYRTNEAWLEAARKNPDVLVFLMRAGEPLLEGDISGAPGFGQGFDGAGLPLVWLGPQGFGLGHQGEVFLGQDTSGTPIFALDMPEDWGLQTSPISGLGEFAEMRGAAAMLSPL